LKYYLGITPAEEPPVGNMILGTRVHAAMEGYYGYGLDPVTVIAALYALAVEAFPEYRTELLAERELAEIMVNGYIEWVAETGKDAGIEVVVTEADLEVPFDIVPGVKLKARMDQVILNQNTGLLSFLDHKTAPNFESHEVLALNPQFKFYSVVQRIIARQAGGENARVAGGMINTLRRVKRTAKSNPPYYQRDEFRYTDVELDAAEARIETICREIVTVRRYLDWVYREQGGALDSVNDVQRSELYPSPRPYECKWDCPFVTVCPMMDDGSDWPGVLLRSGRYKQQDPYDYYREDPLRAVRQVLGMSDPSGSVE
jgi:hypothetical protein